MAKTGLFNFGPGDKHIQQWRDFTHPSTGISYSLAHLDAHIVTYPSGFKVYVTYSHHCFCKHEPRFNDSDDWSYYHPKDPRPFHAKRYELSKGLQSVVQNLHTAYIGHAGHGDYATIPIGELDGKQLFYKVAFTAFRSNKKLRLHVTSAYPIDIREKLKKIKLEVILNKAIKSGSQK